MSHQCFDNVYLFSERLSTWPQKSLGGYQKHSIVLMKTDSIRFSGLDVTAKFRLRSVTFDKPFFSSNFTHTSVLINLDHCRN